MAAFWKNSNIEFFKMGFLQLGKAIEPKITKYLFSLNVPVSSTKFIIQEAADVVISNSTVGGTNGVVRN